MKRSEPSSMDDEPPRKKVDATRRQIKALLPDGCTFSLRKLNFGDLARDHAFGLMVYRNGLTVYTGTLFAEDLKKNGDVYAAICQIREQFTWQGKHIIA